MTGHLHAVSGLAAVLPTAVCILSTDGTLVAASPAARSLFGIADGATLPDLGLLLDPGEETELRVALSDMITNRQTGCDLSITLRNPTVDGPAQLFSARLSPIPADFRIIGAALVLSDQANAGTLTWDTQDPSSRAAEKPSDVTFDLHESPAGRGRLVAVEGDLAALAGPAASGDTGWQTLLAHVRPDDRAAFERRKGAARAAGTRLDATLPVAHPVRGLCRLTLSAQPHPRPDGGVLWSGQIGDITGQTEARPRTAADTALLEERLRLATSAAEIGIWDYDVIGDRLTWDDAMLALHGMSAAEFDGTLDGWKRCIHPEDLPVSERRFFSAMGTGAPFNDNFRIIRPDGEIRHIKARAQIILDAAGRPVRALGVNYDITEQETTERRLAEAIEELHETHERISRLADNAPHALYEYHEDTGGNVTFPYFSGATVQLLGLDPEQISQGDAALFDRINVQDLPGVVDAIDRSRKALTPFRATYRFEHPEHGERWISADALPFRHEDGSTTWYGNLHDVTQQVLTELRALETARTLRATLTRLHKLTDNAPHALYEFHMATDGRLTFPYASANIGRILGVPPDPLALDGQSAFARVYDEDLPELFEAIETSRNDLSPFHARFRIHHPETGTRWITAASLPYRQEDGSTLWYGNMFDVTDQVAADERSRETTEQLRLALMRLNALTDSTPTAVFEYRPLPDGRFELPFFNAKLPEITGVTRAEIEADPQAFTRYIPLDELAWITEKLDQAGRDLTPVTFKHRLVHPENGLRWILSSSQPRQQMEGGVVFSCSLMDVTEQEEANERAAEAAEQVRRAHAKILQMAESTPGALFEWVLTPDRKASFNFYSSNLPDLLGVTPEALDADGAAVFTTIPAEDAVEVKQAIETAAATLTTFEHTHRVVHPTRGLRWAMVSANPTPMPDGSIAWSGYTADVTEQAEAERRAADAKRDLERAHLRLSSVAEIAPVGLYEYIWYGPGEVRFTYTSAYFEELVGFTRQEIQELQGGIFQRIHPEDIGAYAATVSEASKSMTPRRVRFRIIIPERGTRWVAAAATPRKSEDGHVIWTGALIDVTADVEREAKLKHLHEAAETMRSENERQALHDGLTGLPNRRYYDRMLASRLAGADEGQARDCVLIRLDLDHFKYVNDTLGHEAGDLVLVRVAEILRDHMRQGDFAARIGGDEYSILLGPGTSEAEACGLVERIRTHLAEPLIYDGRQCRFGASFGIAATDDLRAMGDDIQMFADAALYRAKTGGRNRLALFTPDLHREILTDRRLAVEIHEALDRDQFVPYFQPQVAAPDGRLVGVETLLRWEHPQSGILSPAAFMHVAEQLRLVPDIDRIMMMKSRDALERLRLAGAEIPKISFNVSSGRMHDPDVVALAREIAAGPTRVTFELLESILVEEENDVFRYHLDLLRESGIDIEIDDFGSGHASIVGLMAIGPSALKIDQRIIAPVAQDPRSRNLVRAIVEIAETLGIRTVAEGVETEDQAEVLRSIGCGVLQGYLFSRPLSEARLLDYMRGAALRSA